MCWFKWESVIESLNGKGKPSQKFIRWKKLSNLPLPAIPLPSSPHTYTEVAWHFGKFIVDLLQGYGKFKVILNRDYRVPWFCPLTRKKVYTKWQLSHFAFHKDMGNIASKWQNWKSDPRKHAHYYEEKQGKALLLSWLFQVTCNFTWILESVFSF